MNRDQDCLDCDEESRCYEYYILSGDEEKDMRKHGCSEEELKIFGY